MIRKNYTIVKLLIFAGIMSVPVSAVYSQTRHPSKEQSKQFVPNTPKGPVWLGVSLAKKADGEPGVRVTGVLRGSPAPASGIKEGDRIVEIAGSVTRTYPEIRIVMRGHRSGDSISVKVLRNGRTKTLKFSLRSKPPTRAIVRQQLVGLPAPDVRLQALGSANQVMLSSFKGKPTLLDFWATWCGPCKLANKNLKGMKKRYGDKIAVVQISSEKLSTIQGHIQGRQKAGVVLQDPAGYASDKFFVSILPQVVLLDADHNVLAVIFNSDDEWKLLDAKIAKLLQ